MMPRPPSEHDWQEKTRPDLTKIPPPVRLESEPPESRDHDTILGKMMAALAKNDRVMRELQAAHETLTREVGGLRRDIDKDREALVQGASTRAAAHSSNRLAVMMGGLFTLWEVASPYVAELLKAMHHQ